jgi:hypothetical protein
MSTARLERLISGFSADNLAPGCNEFRGGNLFYDIWAKNVILASCKTFFSIEFSNKSGVYVMCVRYWAVLISGIMTYSSIYLFERLEAFP